MRLVIEGVTRAQDGALPGKASTGDRATCRRAGVSRLMRIVRQVIGAPDYGAYIEHCRRAGHPVHLTEREYVGEFFERKGRTPRCC